MFDGQSFNFAPPFGGAGNKRTYPYILMHELLAANVNTAGRYVGKVKGLSGTTYATRNTDVATRVDPYFNQYKRAIYFDISGPSDILANLTAAQILAAAEASWDARRAAGADLIVAFTVTPATTVGGGVVNYYTAPQEAVRIAYNNLLRANANRKYDVLVDMAALPHAVNFGQDLTYSYDGLHPQEAFAAEIAGLGYNAMDIMGEF